ncbi:MAG: hypothetical protein IT364_19460 [Candidatus Hydrogenedentes bacterium]|nr:hypothetical protein [Candidatus Hydrogenedentota bacterium]
MDSLKCQTSTATPAEPGGLPNGLGGVVPLWWRNLPFDYEVPLFQGKMYIYPDNTHRILFGSEIAPSSEFRERVQTFVAMGEEERHVQILKARMRKYLGLEPRMSSDSSVRVREAYEELSGAWSVKSIVQGALKIGLAEPEEAVLVRALGQAVFGYAHPEVLAALKQLDGNPVPFAENDVKNWIRSVRYTLDPPKPPTTRPEPPPPSFEGGRAAARQALIDGLHKDQSAYKFWQALEYLTFTAPELVTNWLSTWENPQEGPTMLKAGYELGSAFAYLCKTDREKHLKKLLRAHDPYVQVSAAVYLAFESETEGRKALEKFAAFPGDPGAWAALTLARRGRKDAVPRLLEVFGGNVDSWSLAVLLRTQAVILLSNSAVASGVPLPSPPAPSHPPAEAVDYAGYYLSWWREHEPKVRLYDPWFPVLADQKID